MGDVVLHNQTETTVFEAWLLISVNSETKPVALEAAISKKDLTNK